jgi:tRNA dimethylallyltransferase
LKAEASFSTPRPRGTFDAASANSLLLCGIFYKSPFHLVSSSLPATTIFLLGPTAVGKSDLAVELAERVGAEIIGADAFQIYAGLDLLSAKPSPELRVRVPHHLIGEIPIAESFDVARYRALALARIEEVAARGKIPLVCGGTGFYVRALTHGLADLPPADPALRATLEAQPLSQLVEKLRALDSDSQVDENNPRRVIRALEVCLLTGRPFSSFRTDWTEAPAVRGVILTRPTEDLRARIAARTGAMFAAGVLDEVAAIPADSIGPTAGQMLGLREIRAHLAGKLTREACITAITVATRQYAKRQMTWFRRECGYQWLDLSTTQDPLDSLSAVFNNA